MWWNTKYMKYMYIVTREMLDNFCTSGKIWWADSNYVWVWFNSSYNNASCANRSDRLIYQYNIYNIEGCCRFIMHVYSISFQSYHSGVLIQSSSIHPESFCKSMPIERKRKKCTARIIIIIILSSNFSRVYFPIDFKFIAFSVCVCSSRAKSWFGLHHLIMLNRERKKKVKPIFRLLWSKKKTHTHTYLK